MPENLVVLGAEKGEGLQEAPSAAKILELLYQLNPGLSDRQFAALADAVAKAAMARLHEDRTQGNAAALELYKTLGELRALTEDSLSFGNTLSEIREELGQRRRADSVSREVTERLRAEIQQQAEELAALRSQNAALTLSAQQQPVRWLQLGAASFSGKSCFRPDQIRRIVAIRFFVERLPRGEMEPTAIVKQVLSASKEHCPSIWAGEMEGAENLKREGAGRKKGPRPLLPADAKKLDKAYREAVKAIAALVENEFHGISGFAAYAEELTIEAGMLDSEQQILGGILFESLGGELRKMSSQPLHLPLNLSRVAALGYPMVFPGSVLVTLPRKVMKMGKLDAQRARRDGSLIPEIFRVNAEKDPETANIQRFVLSVE